MPRTELTKIQQIVIDTLTKTPGGLEGHSLYARCASDAKTVQREVRELNLALGEDVVIWTRVKRNGEPRKAGRSVLFLLAEHASDEQRRYYAEFRDRFTTSVTDRTVAELNSQEMESVADSIHSLKERRALLHFHAGVTAQDRGDMVTREREFAKGAAILRELVAM